MSIIPLLTYILRARGYSLTLGATMVAAMGFGMILASSSWSPGRSLGTQETINPGCHGRDGMCCADTTGRSLILMFVLLVILGAAFVTVLTMTPAIMTDVTDAQERGTVMAASMVAVGIAVITFPTIASYVLASWGWSAIAWTGAVLMSLAFIQISFLRRTRGWSMGSPRCCDRRGCATK